MRKAQQDKHGNKGGLKCDSRLLRLHGKKASANIEAVTQHDAPTIRLLKRLPLPWNCAVMQPTTRALAISALPALWHLVVVAAPVRYRRRRSLNFSVCTLLRPLPPSVLTEPTLQTRTSPDSRRLAMALTVCEPCLSKGTCTAAFTSSVSHKKGPAQAMRQAKPLLSEWCPLQPC